MIPGTLQFDSLPQYFLFVRHHTHQATNHCQPSFYFLSPVIGHSKSVLLLFMVLLELFRLYFDHKTSSPIALPAFVSEFMSFFHFLSPVIRLLEHSKWMLLSCMAFLQLHVVCLYFDFKTSSSNALPFFVSELMSFFYFLRQSFDYMNIQNGCSGYIWHSYTYFVYIFTFKTIFSECIACLRFRFHVFHLLSCASHSTK